MSKKTILVDAWNTFITDEGVDEEMKVILDSYNNAKIIATNANKEQQIEYGVVNMPYPVFTLSHQPDKTNSKYFLKLFKEYNLLANDILYFEHNEEAVKSARSLGIETLWLQKGSSLELLRIFLKDNL